MFDRLVVSTTQKRGRTRARFFLGTAALYAFVLGCAFVLSVLASAPRLADTHSILTLVGPPPLIGGDSRPRPPTTRRPLQSEPRPDPNHVRDLDTLLSRRNTAPPILQIPDGSRDGTDRDLSPPPGIGGPVGFPQGLGTDEAAPSPDHPKQKPPAQTAAFDNKPLRVTSNVLQGKAITRPKPTYPPLAVQTRLQGEVSVEVIISPDGRVESARVISGHPMFAQCARDAALCWRFEPTLLNQVPVRVAGVITFVFKLRE